MFNHNSAREQLIGTLIAYGRQLLLPLIERHIWCYVSLQLRLGGDIVKVRGARHSEKKKKIQNGRSVGLEIGGNPG